MVASMSELINVFAGRWAIALIAISCGTALELMVGDSRHSVSSRLRGVCFWMLYVIGFVVATVILQATMGILSLRPPVTLDLRPFAHSDYLITATAGLVIISIIPVMLGDLLYYWFHRLQYSTPFSGDSTRCTTPTKT